MFGPAAKAATVTASGEAETFQLLAHQGGWDEVLLVGVPLSLIGGLLWLANRRVNSQLEEVARAAEAEGAAEAATEPDPDGSP